MFMDLNEIEGLLDGVLTLDCPKIELLPRNKDKPILAGSGSITLTTEKLFQLKFFSTVPMEIEELFDRFEWAPGEIISDEHYYDLVAYDVKGRKWNANRFLPDKNTGPVGTVIEASLPETSLYSEKPFDDEGRPQSLAYYMQGRLDFPFNTSVTTAETVENEVRSRSSGWTLAKFTACSIDFEVQHVGNNTRLRANSSVVPMNSITANRIFEAFCFVVAFPGIWSLQNLNNSSEVKFRLRTERGDTQRSRIPKPLQYQGKNPVDSIKLFECYLEYALMDTESCVHPVSILNSSILQSGKSALQVQAITLSVVIESLLKDHFGEIYELDLELEGQIDMVSSMVEKKEGLNQNFTQRISGMLSSMKHPRAKDILIPLRDAGNIKPLLVKTYGDLRNKSAHAHSASGGDIQNYLNQINAVLVLYYHLVFLLIGYQGAYTEYGQYGYPNHQFSGKLPLTSQ